MFVETSFLSQKIELNEIETSKECSRPEIHADVDMSEM